MKPTCEKPDLRPAQPAGHASARHRDCGEAQGAEHGPAIEAAVPRQRGGNTQ